MRSVVSLCLVAALIVPQAASAQFGSIFRDAMRGASKPAAKPTPPPTGTATDKGCAQAGQTARSPGILGSVLGGAARRTIGRTGIGYYVPLPEFSDVLTAAFACKLEPTEQKKAAEATNTATRSGTVGSSSSWESDARPGVTGTSTVTGKTASRTEGSCMTVTDVVIINGEESRAEKRMCRRPGEARYTLAA